MLATWVEGGASNLIMNELAIAASQQFVGGGDDRAVRTQDDGIGWGLDGGERVDEGEPCTVFRG